MDYQQPPEIVITHTEKHPVKEEVIEHVARLLARADGVDPDADMRCHSEPDSNILWCDLSGEAFASLGLPPIPKPTFSAMWNKYREPAEKLLAQIFGSSRPPMNVDPPNWTGDPVR